MAPLSSPLPFSLSNNNNSNNNSGEMMMINKNTARNNGNKVRRQQPQYNDKAGRDIVLDGFIISIPQKKKRKIKNNKINKSNKRNNANDLDQDDIDNDEDDFGYFNGWDDADQKEQDDCLEDDDNEDEEEDDHDTAISEVTWMTFRAEMMREALMMEYAKKRLARRQREEQQQQQQLEQQQEEERSTTTAKDTKKKETEGLGRTRTKTTSCYRGSDNHDQGVNIRRRASCLNLTTKLPKEGLLFGGNSSNNNSRMHYPSYRTDVHNAARRPTRENDQQEYDDEPVVIDHPQVLSSSKIMNRTMSTPDLIRHQRLSNSLLQKWVPWGNTNAMMHTKEQDSIMEEDEDGMIELENYGKRKGGGVGELTVEFGLRPLHRGESTLGDHEEDEGDTEFDILVAEHHPQQPNHNSFSANNNTNNDHALLVNSIIELKLQLAQKQSIIDELSSKYNRVLLENEYLIKQQKQNDHPEKNHEQKNHKQKKNNKQLQQQQQQQRPHSSTPTDKMNAQKQHQHQLQAMMVQQQQPQSNASNISSGAAINGRNENSFQQQQQQQPRERLPQEEEEEEHKDHNEGITWPCSNDTNRSDGKLFRPPSSLTRSITNGCTSTSTSTTANNNNNHNKMVLRPVASLANIGTMLLRRKSSDVGAASVSSGSSSTPSSNNNINNNNLNNKNGNNNDGNDKDFLIEEGNHNTAVATNNDDCANMEVDSQSKLLSKPWFMRQVSSEMS